ncbi:glycan biosynthesis hexose transferase WsfD [Allokutzneria oryzae]|uniref:Glycosyltransferase RgtA/B/C/D-like domain-containing protein n=1 Tax=Allokutzneria oryzae TaxID=1378989 RepID=A0ABV6A3G1_9PSEU
MSRVRRFASQDALLGAGVFVTSLGILLFRFLVPRPVGFSDNGDGWRVLCQVGAHELGGPSTDFFVRFHYKATPVCPDVNYVTSHLWPAKLSQLAGRVLGTAPGLNLVLLGGVYCLAVATGITLVVMGLRTALRWRLVAATALLLLLGDSAFFGYFASVTTEGASFLGITVTVGGLLLMCRDGRWRYTGAAVTTVGGVVLCNTKMQAVILLPFLVVAVLLLRKGGQQGWARWGLPVLVAVAVSGVTGFLQLSSATGLPGSDTREINSYHAVFNTVLDGKHDARADLRALGLPESFERYRGTMHWGPGNAQNDPLWPQYRGKFTAENLMNFYLTHPWRTVGILDRAAEDLLTLRPEASGSFGENQGFAPKAQEWRVPVLSGLMRLAAPFGLVVLLPLWLMTGYAAVRFWRNRREFCVIVLMVLCMALVQFLVAGLGEGIENVKHQVIAAFATMFAGMIAAFGLFPRPDEWSGRVEKPTEPADEVGVSEFVTA